MLILLYTLIGLGFIALIAGGIWALIKAFEKSVWWGLGCLFLSPLSLVFLIVHWQVAKRPFCVQLAGCALVFGALLALPNKGSAIPTFWSAPNVAGNEPGALAPASHDPITELRTREAELRARKAAIDPQDTGAIAQLQADVLKYNADLRAATGAQMPAGYTAEPAATPAPAAPPSKIASQLQGQLITVRNGETVPFLETTGRQVKYYAIYFSAHWCPPCRAFTPELVAWYNKHRATHPEFELIFVSSDRSPLEMTNYMSGAAMPWPAVAFDKKKSSGLTSYAGNGIPCLVLTDADGKVLADSFVNGKYRGPRPVLAEMSKVLGSTGTILAQAE